ncbi:MAG: Hsp33 family molecular chaperone [Brucellaceae bacterium]|nr:Hsp33 family molecular chaperone [Brucellaceae bacterium]
MSDSPSRLGDFDHAGDDTVVPFHVNELDARGRAVQLGPILDAVLARHAYPEPVAALLAEAMVVTALVGTSLKFDGRFTLQSQTDGPVSLIVVDFKTPSSMRAYARFDETWDWTAVEPGTSIQASLLGKGMLGMTIDQGAHMQRYQGVVELAGTGFEEAAKTYFRQSEQIPTDMRIAVARLASAGGTGEPQGGHWRAGGILVQFLPDAPERMHMGDLPGGDGAEDIEADIDDAWRETQVLVATAGPDELTDPHVGVERLLYRLFHEHGVRVYPGQQVLDDCSCSRAKIRNLLTTFSAEEIAESRTDDGTIEVSCEFCSQRYVFEAAEFPAESD